MHQNNSRTFTNPKTVQIFDRFATYYGANPYKASAMFNLIPHLEHQNPAYFPKGGMYSIIESLTALAKDLGVKFFTGQKVDEIIVWSKQVRGLSVNKKILDFDVVVSNLDISNTYRKLLPLHKTPKSLQKQNLSASAIVFYWGIDRQFDELNLHNVFFCEKYKEEFETVFEKQSICTDPSIYLYISSLNEPKDAPEGFQNWYVMVNAPHNAGQNWGKLVKKTRKNVIKKLNKVLKTDIEKHIISEDFLTPLKIETRTTSIAGSLYGTSSNSRLSPFFRPANFTKQIKNLYFCGASVHPGGGIPLSLLSAKIVADLVKKQS
jgi:phytoene desaturase